MRQLKEVYRGTKYIPGGLEGKLIEFDNAGFVITYGVTVEDLAPLERFLLPENMTSGAEESSSVDTTEAPETTKLVETTLAVETTKTPETTKSQEKTKSKSKGE